jgi:hypothetical protein
VQLRTRTNADTVRRQRVKVGITAGALDPMHELFGQCAKINQHQRDVGGASFKLGDRCLARCTQASAEISMIAVGHIGV